MQWLSFVAGYIKYPELILHSTAHTRFYGSADVHIGACDGAVG
jgi:hypothetical protein